MSFRISWHHESNRRRWIVTSNCSAVGFGDAELAGGLSATAGLAGLAFPMPKRIKRNRATLSPRF